ncbi:MAG: 23S rRNA (adenine(2503)-C(2))-methyltransferase RlmN [Deinococcales bacterium]
MSRPLPSVYDLAPEALWLPDGEPDYRREQIARWLYRRGVQSFDAMTNLPRSLRSALAAQLRLSPYQAVQRFPSRDGSVRYLFTLADGLRTEAVYMPYAGRRTVCVSSMVGCPAGCAFCATGALGFGRNLGRGEIVGQLLAVAAGEGVAPVDIRNVVLMGMGEALLNYDNAVAAVRTLVSPAALDLSPRRITLSTVGLPSRIRRLAGESLPLVLALSLHAPDDETRRRIIPTAHAYGVADIMAAVRAYQEATGRRVSIEYTLLAGVNDDVARARALAELLAGLKSHVNLIPFNRWPGSGFDESSPGVTERFRAELERHRIPVSVRFSRGRDAGGACGQLALRERGRDGPAVAVTGAPEGPGQSRP